MCWHYLFICIYSIYFIDTSTLCVVMYFMVYVYVEESCVRVDVVGCV